jgi:serine/threonine protein kinase
VATDPLIGSELDQYRIDFRLGAGGMGVVYRARDLNLGRDVAVKVLPSTLAGETEARQRFQREIRLAAGIEHPNVVPLYDAGYAQGHLFIVMRLIDGQDLSQLLAVGPLGRPRALALIRQVASGLECVHQRGLVHRDVKPQNIMIASPGTPSEHAFLADFGIARAVEGTTVLTRGAIGTVEYMAPELVEWQPASPRSDQYALACVLFATLAGRSPFKGMDLPRAHVDKDPPSLRSIDPSTPLSLDLAIARALSKTPDARFPTVVAFADACLHPVQETRESQGIIRNVLRRVFPVVQTHDLRGSKLDDAPAGARPLSADEIRSWKSSDSVAPGDRTVYHTYFREVLARLEQRTGARHDSNIESYDAAKRRYYWMLGRDDERYWALVELNGAVDPAQRIVIRIAADPVSESIDSEALRVEGWYTEVRQDRSPPRAFGWRQLWQYLDDIVTEGSYEQQKDQLAQACSNAAVLLKPSHWSQRVDASWTTPTRARRRPGGSQPQPAPKPAASRRHQPAAQQALTQCVRELTERMDALAQEFGLEIKEGKTGHNYRPTVRERGVTYTSGIGVWNSSRGVEFNLQVLRELGDDAGADNLLQQLERATGTRNLPRSWPSLPCALIMANWQRVRTQVIEPYFRARARNSSS